MVNKPASIPVSFFFFGKDVMTGTSVFRERTQKKSFFPFSTKRYMNPKALHHIVRSRTLKIVSNQQLLMIYVDATLRILRGGAFW